MNHTIILTTKESEALHDCLNDVAMQMDDDNRDLQSYAVRNFTPTS